MRHISFPLTFRFVRRRYTVSLPFSPFSYRESDFFPSLISRIWPPLLPKPASRNDFAAGTVSHPLGHDNACQACLVCARPLALPSAASYLVSPSIALITPLGLVPVSPAFAYFSPLLAFISFYPHHFLFNILLQFLKQYLIHRFLPINIFNDYTTTTNYCY